MAAFPIGERFAVISLTAALCDAPHHVHRAPLLGRLRARLHPRPAGRCGRSPHERRDRPKAAAPTRGRAARALPRRRADRAALGAASGRRLPAAADRAAARRPGCRACRARRRGRRRLATASSPARRLGRPPRRPVERPPAHRPLRWAVPAALRAASTAALLWIAASRATRRCPAAFALIAALAFRHYDLVYRPRFQGVAPPRWVEPSPAAGTGGCCSLRAAGRRRAARPACSSSPASSASLFVGECGRRVGARIGRAGSRVYEDEEDEGDVIGMVLAAGAGRRLQPLTDDLPKTLLPVDGERTILDIALGNLAPRRARRVVVVTGFAAHRHRRAPGRARAAPRRRARARLQPQGRGVEQRLLAVVRARALRAGRAARQRRHRPPARGRGEAARRPRARRPRARAWTTRRRSARRR